MGIPRLFKLPTHKRFHYTPLYYDEQKEELEERIRKIELEYGKVKNNKEYTPGIKKGQMRNYYYRNRGERSNSTARVLIILLFLLALAYFLFFR